MNATKEELINFLEQEVLIPVETNPQADKIIKKKVNFTRVQLNKQVSAEKVEQYFWSAMATDNGVDSYLKIKRIGGQHLKMLGLSLKDYAEENDCKFITKPTANRGFELLLVLL